MINGKSLIVDHSPLFIKNKGYCFSFVFLLNYLHTVISICNTGGEETAGLVALNTIGEFQN
jgi:hypothetical protein